MLTSIEFQVTGISTSKLAGICFDSSGNVYASDVFASTIFKIRPTSYSTGVNEVFADGKSGLNGPYGMATDRLNNLYVANSEAWELLRFTPSGGSIVR